jgi:hypothetical protein
MAIKMRHTQRGVRDRIVQMLGFRRHHSLKIAHNRVFSQYGGGAWRFW